MKRLGIELDSEIHSAAKVRAFTLGKTLTSYIIDLIMKDLQQAKENE